MFFISEFAWKQWPDGDYAIPMSVYGCPDPESNEWKHKRYAVKLLAHSIYKVYDFVDLSLKNDFFNLGPFGFYQLKINVCVKQRSNTERYANRQTSFEDRLLETAEWPPGNYVVYPKDEVCPKGKYN